MQEFLDMGGYSAFVWPSFAVWALVMAGLTIWCLMDRKRQITKAEALEAALGGRKRASSAGGES